MVTKLQRCSIVLLAGLLILGLGASAQAFEALCGPTGVLKYNQEKTFDGYMLYSPNKSTTTYLLDNEGQIVHTWKSDYFPGRYCYLLENGHLLRGAQILNDKGKIIRPAPVDATWGMLQEIDWDGNVVWEYKMLSDKITAHHAFYRMPNGNTLLLGFEGVSKDEARKLGRKNIFEGRMGFGKESTDEYWLDFIREVTPAGKVAWEWHLKDHLGMGRDKVNFNFILPRATGINYSSYDWSHGNSISYLPDTDQVLINFRNLSEFMLINHKTGKIEDRWGNDTTWNPEARKPIWVDDGDQIVFGSHDAHRIAKGLPGAGNYLLLDNGSERPERQRSRIVEIDAKTKKIVWEYSPKGIGFMTHRQGSVQRLPNGNTFVCSANHGHVFEVTPDKQVVWDFVNPLFKDGKAKIFTTDDVDGVSYAHGGSLNMIHRAYKYGKDFPGLKGRDLTPQGYIAGDDAPVFYKVWKRGLESDGAVGTADDEEMEDDGPTMHTY